MQKKLCVCLGLEEKAAICNKVKTLTANQVRIRDETEENEGNHVQHIHDTGRNQITIAHTESHAHFFSCG